MQKFNRCQVWLSKRLSPSQTSINGASVWLMIMSVLQVRSKLSLLMILTISLPKKGARKSLAV